MHPKLWILEEDRFVGGLMQTILVTEIRGIQIRLFHTADSVLRASGTPHMMIADTDIGGKMKGTEVVGIIRRRNPHMAVVFSSCFGQPPPTSLRPWDSYLPKPFSAAALVQKVTTTLAKALRPTVPPIQHHSERPRRSTHH